MSEIQDQINKILSDPEALKQVQSLGAQLGLGNSMPQEAPPAPKPPETGNSFQGAEMVNAVSQLAPLMQSFSADDEVSALLNALRPFLSEEKLSRLDQAQRLMRLVRVIPLIKDSGLF